MMGTKYPKDQRNKDFPTLFLEEKKRRKKLECKF